MVEIIKLQKKHHNLRHLVQLANIRKRGCTRITEQLTGEFHPDQEKQSSLLLGASFQVQFSSLGINWSLGIPNRWIAPLENYYPRI